jgi:hypothetical protein
MYTTLRERQADLEAFAKAVGAGSMQQVPKEKSRRVKIKNRAIIGAMAFSIFLAANPVGDMLEGGNVALAEESVVSPTPVDFFVSPQVNNRWLEKLADPNDNDGPFAMVKQEQETVRALLRTMPKRRPVRVFDGAVPISQPRAFDVEVDKIGPERKVFEMPPGKRTLYFRDLFALLPFQVNERKFVFAYYIVSPTYSAEDLKDAVYRARIHPVDGNSCKVSCYDPLTDSSVKIRIRDRSHESLTVDLPTVDTPRLLVVEE